MTLPHMTATLWDYPTPVGFHEHSQSYKCTLTFKSSGAGRPKTWTLPFFVGPAWSDTPSVYDVLECLFSDASAGQETFESFCEEYGYNSDSRKAYATWEKCVKTDRKLRRFLGSEFDAIAEEVRRING